LTKNSIALRDFRLPQRLTTTCRKGAIRALFLQPALALNLRDDLGSQHLSAHSHPFGWRRLGLETGEESLQFWSLSRRLMHWNMRGQAVIKNDSVGASP